MLQLIISLVLFSSAFGREILPLAFTGNGKIVGGVETRIEEFPYQVSVTYYLGHMCGGSIINADTVLTAAHCTYGRTPCSLYVRAGTSSLNDEENPGQIRNVSKIIQHEKFSINTVDNDISILKLLQPLTFNDKIQPISLQPAKREIGDGSPIVVTGWGATQEGSSTVNTLHKVILNNVNAEQCKQSYGTSITRRMFCAQAPGKDACQGDSGGPAVQDGRLVGIVSWGIGCAEPDFPGVFTKVSAMRGWINRNLYN